MLLFRPAPGNAKIGSEPSKMCQYKISKFRLEEPNNYKERMSTHVIRTQPCLRIIMNILWPILDVQNDENQSTCLTRDNGNSKSVPSCFCIRTYILNPENRFTFDKKLLAKIFKIHHIVVFNVHKKIVEMSRLRIRVFDLRIP